MIIKLQKDQSLEKHCYFRNLNYHAFKLLVKIILVEIFDIVNWYILLDKLVTLGLVII